MSPDPVRVGSGADESYMPLYTAPMRVLEDVGDVGDGPGSVHFHSMYLPLIYFETVHSEEGYTRVLTSTDGKAPLFPFESERTKFRTTVLGRPSELRRLVVNDLQLEEVSLDKQQLTWEDTKELLNSVALKSAEESALVKRLDRFKQNHREIRRWAKTEGIDKPPPGRLS